MIAAFRDLNVGSVMRGGKDTRSLVIVKLIWQIGDGAVPGLAGEATLGHTRVTFSAR